MQQIYERELAGNSAVEQVGIMLTTIQQVWLLEKGLRKTVDRQRDGSEGSDHDTSSLTRALQDDACPVHDEDVLVYVRQSLLMVRSKIENSVEEELEIQSYAPDHARLLFLLRLRRVLLIALQSSSVLQGCCLRRGSMPVLSLFLLSVWHGKQYIC